MKEFKTNTIIFTIIFITSSFIQAENSGNEIIFKTNLINNYLLHIFCVAEIGEFKSDSDYAEKYKFTVDSTDLIKLKNNEENLAFADGKAGKFTYFCFFLPSYLELNNKEEFIQYYAILQKSLETNDFQEFMEKYSIPTDDPFISENLNFWLNIPDSIHQQMVAPVNDEFKKVSEIFIKNLDSYEKHVWPHAKEELENQIRYYTKLFKKEKFIQKWENFTKLKFGADYQIFLTYSNKKGPNANSMSFDKNMFYYNFSDQRILDFVNHEIGTHLIVPLFWNDKRIEPYFAEDFSKVYNAIEVLCLFYNKKIFNKDSLGYNMNDYDADEYEKIYNKYYTEEISHIDLLLKGIEEIE
ncbi:MAG: hypothetical protein PVH88_25725 [Ignavibacteria bacterium]|jgi:hypothetical protein